MSTPLIQSVLLEMRSMAETGGLERPGANVDTVVGSGGFADELHASLERINHLQQNAADQVHAFEAGVPGVELNDVMVDVQKASVAFEMGVQVRNRLLNAYREIMNMQI